jgi:hypothetical protein
MCLDADDTQRSGISVGCSVELIARCERVHVTRKSAQSSRVPFTSGPLGENSPPRGILRVRQMRQELRPLRRRLDDRGTRRRGQAKSEVLIAGAWTRCRGNGDALAHVLARDDRLVGRTEHSLPESRHDVSAGAGLSQGVYCRSAVLGRHVCDFLRSHFLESAGRGKEIRLANCVQEQASLDVTFAE